MARVVAATSAEGKKKLAKVVNCCCSCHETIHVGEEIWPIIKKRGGVVTYVYNALGNALPVYSSRTFTWVHRKCVQSEAVLPVCPFWAGTTTCGFGDKCFYSHPVTLREPHTAAFKQKSKRQKRSRGKVGIFRRWLLDTFGPETLKNGSGILDIAGGKGELSFQLLNLNGISSTLIDPRSMLLDECIHKLKQGLYTWNPLYSEYICQSTYSESRISPKTPKHLKIFFNDATLQWYDRASAEEVNEDDEGRRFIQDALAFANGRILVGESGLLQKYEKGVAKEDMEVLSDHNGNGPSMVVTDYREALDLLQNSSVVLGLHPDGAAEPIVDFCLKYNKPFAILPCCTCSKDFPNRLNEKDGTLIKSYTDFIGYLKRKDPVRIQSAILEGMGGKNLVLYMMPTAKSE
eukprot:Stramenopile-MAST_4_protein_1427